jgi:hypothetical protein
MKNRRRHGRYLSSQFARWTICRPLPKAFSAHGAGNRSCEAAVGMRSVAHFMRIR